jgi:hypothetical protein
MYTRKHVQKTITLGAGENRAQISMDIPGGRLVGFATKSFGTLPGGASADVSIADGANDILKALDVDFSEITTKASTREIITSLSHENANDITVTVSTTAVIANATSYSVKVILFYAAKELKAETLTLEHCN